MKKYLLATVALLFSSTAWSQALVYPSDIGSGTFNVSTYGAAGDGVTDDTAAISATLAAAIAGGAKGGAWSEVFFPAGTYLVSNTIGFGNNQNTAKRAIIRGSGAGVTTIRLMDNAPGFQVPAIPTPVVDPCIGCAGDVQAFMDQIDDITVNVGYGNPGASGVRMTVNNVGGLRNINIISPSASSGVVGLDLTPSFQGPATYDTVTVRGFNIGVRFTANEYIATLKDLSLIGQRSVGLFSSSFQFTIDGLYSLNSVPTLDLEGQAIATIAHAQITSPNPTTTTAVAALVKNGAALHINNSYIGPGYPASAQLADRVNLGPGQIDCATVTTLSSVTTYNPSCTPMILSDDRPTIPPLGSLTNWQQATTLTSAGLQTTLNSGKSTIYLNNLPNPSVYAATSTITIPTTVNRLIGFGAAVSIGSASGFDSTTPLFLIASGRTTPLVVEDFEVRCGLIPQDPGCSINWFYDPSGNDSVDIIMRDMLVPPQGNLYNGSIGVGKKGKLFLINVANGPVLTTNRDVIAWGLDVESANKTHLINNGSNVWLYGYKHEQTGTLVQTLGGGTSTVFGDFLIQNFDVPVNMPMFDVVNGSTCVDATEFSNFPAGRGHTAYTVLMGDSATGQVFYNTSAFPTIPAGHAYINACASASALSSSTCLGSASAACVAASAIATIGVSSP